MKFLSLKMKNWRAYYGVQEIAFSTDTAKPVTVILATNNSGKTNIVNAFTWVLFDKFTKGFRRPDNLVNEQALAEDGAEATMSVEVRYEIDGSIYTATRSQIGGAAASRTSVAVLNQDGETLTSDLAPLWSYLPRDLYNNFFFASENFTSDESDLVQSGAASATTVLLGIDMYRQAAKDLRAAKSLPAMKVAGGSDSKLRETQKAVDTANAALRANSERIEALESQLIPDAETAYTAAKQAASGIDKAGVAEYEKNRARLQAAYAEALRTRENAVTSHSDILANAFRFYIDPTVVTGAQELDAACTDGRIPPRIDLRLIDKCLHEDTCFCKRPLDDESREALEGVRRRVDGGADHEVSLKAVGRRDMLHAAHSDTCHWLEEQSEHLELRGKPTFAKLVNASQNAIGAAQAAVVQAQQALEDLSSANTDADAREKMLTAMTSADRAHQRLVNELKQLQAEQPELEKSYREADGAAQKALRANQATSVLADAQDTLEGAREFFQGFHELMLDKARVDFDRLVNEIYTGVVLSNKRIVVNKDFGMQVVGSEGQPAAMSQSEAQLLTTAHLCAIARLAPKYRDMEQAREVAGLGEVETTSGNSMPLVIDAPYSNFDDHYAKAFSEVVATSVSQMIVCTRENATPALESISGRIGAVYSSVFKGMKVKKTEEVSWAGGKAPYTEAGDPGQTHDRSYITVVQKAEQ